MLTGTGDGSYASSRDTSEPDFSKSSMRYDNTREIPAPATAAAAATSPKFTARRDGTSIVCVAPFRRNSQGVAGSKVTQSCDARSAGSFGTPRAFKYAGLA